MWRRRIRIIIAGLVAPLWILALPYSTKLWGPCSSAGASIRMTDNGCAAMSLAIAYTTAAVYAATLVIGGGIGGAWKARRDFRSPPIIVTAILVGVVFGLGFILLQQRMWNFKLRPAGPSFEGATNIFLGLVGFSSLVAVTFCLLGGVPWRRRDEGPPAEIVEAF